MNDENMYDYFGNKIREAKDSKEALEYSEAAKNYGEFVNNEYQQVQRNETEIKKEKIKFWASVIVTAGTIAGVALKVFEVLEFQGRDQEFEKSGYYVNHKRHRP